MSCRLLDLLSHVVVAVDVKDIHDQIECMLIVVHFGVEASQVESIIEIFFVDFTKVFVAAG